MKLVQKRNISLQDMRDNFKIIENDGMLNQANCGMSVTRVFNEECQLCFAAWQAAMHNSKKDWIPYDKSYHFIRGISCLMKRFPGMKKIPFEKLDKYVIAIAVALESGYYKSWNTIPAGKRDKLMILLALHDLQPGEGLIKILPNEKELIKIVEAWNQLNATLHKHGAASKPFGHAKWRTKPSKVIDNIIKSGEWS